MIETWFELGDIELWNSARLRAYLESVGSPLTLTGDCFCEAFTGALVGDEAEYTDPATDGAPWYDPDVPESAQFTGFWPLTVEGLDDNPVSRSVTRSAQGSAAFGPARELPLTITVTGLIIGATCCAARYGLKWLAAALQGCTGGGCGGDCARLYNCCPSTAEAADPEAFNERHRRTLRRVALTSGPTVLDRVGGPCGSTTECLGSNGEVIRVEFVITAASPWQWTDEREVLSVELPRDDGECVTWCIHGGGETGTVCIDPLGDGCGPGTVAVELTDTCPPGSVAWPDRDELDLPCDEPCRLRACTTDTFSCSDTRCRTESPPTAPEADTCFCEPLAVNAAYYELDLSDQPRWFGSAPMITLHAGSEELHRVRVTFYERSATHLGMTCEEVAEAERCAPHSVYSVAYVPANSTVTIDGQISRAFVDCLGSCESSGDVYGADGGPLRSRLMECDKYCVEITTDALAVPAEDAELIIALTGREY